MALTISLSVKSKDIQNSLVAMAKRGEDIRKPLRLMAEDVRVSILKNFRVGGRPKKWPKSQRALKEGGQTLVDKGILRASINYKVSGRGFTEGSNVKYARAHNEGFKGQVRVKAHKRTITQAFGKKLNFPVITTVNSFSKVLNIKKRQFALIQDEDFVIMQETLKEYIVRNRLKRAKAIGRRGRTLRNTVRRFR